MKADIKEWDPEDPKKWDKRLAWTTVWISTFSLTFGFCAWYLVPSLAPHLNAVGFHLDASQLYWLVAMVGLSAGTLRIVWTFLPPIMGTRKLVFMSTILLLIPLGCWIYAVTNPGLPFEVLCYSPSLLASAVAPSQDSWHPPITTSRSRSAGSLSVFKAACRTSAPRSSNSLRRSSSRFPYSES